MAENLNVTRFANGDPIANPAEDKAWTAAGLKGMPAYSIYENNVDYRDRWGLLYNYFVITDTRGVCPDGWRIPENKDWDELETFLGKPSASSKLKSKKGWINNGNGLDEVFFNGLPGGFRLKGGEYRLGVRVGYWWSKTLDKAGDATSILLFDYDTKIFRIQYPKDLGQSIRCIK